jgi:hypothetical protein
MGGGRLIFGVYIVCNFVQGNVLGGCKMKTLRLFENNPQIFLAISSLATNNKSSELSACNLVHKID